VKQEDEPQVSPPAPLPGPKQPAPIQPAPPVTQVPRQPPPSEGEVPPVQIPQPKPPLTDQQLNKLLDDPEATLEISEPISMPNPTAGKYSLPGIEKLPAVVSGKAQVQAVGWHNAGHLQKAAELPAKGAGFISRDHGKKDFGTDVMINLITNAMAAVEKKFPSRPPVVVGSIANHTGGKLLNLSGHAHASHQTGLDADIGIPSNRPVKGLWQACAGDCSVGGRMSDQLDEERFWNFLQTMACAENKPVMAMFLDRSIKKELCRYVRQTTHEDLSDAKSCAFQTLQRIHHWPGHKDHVHVRLVCPEKSACQNTWVTLDNGTGC
jgi:penicillin-insensitive murein endopeptidase